MIFLCYQINTMEHINYAMLKTDFQCIWIVFFLISLSVGPIVKKKN